MARAKLTKTTLDGLRPREKAYIVRDTELVGLCVQIGKSGSKSWFLEYRPYPGGRKIAKKRFRMGSTSTLTPQQARAEAQELLAGIRRGLDPGALQQEARAPLTVADLIARYLEIGLVVRSGRRIGEPLKPQVAKNKRTNLANHVLPVLGKRLLPSLTRTDVEELAKAITEGVTARDEKVGPRARVIVTGGAGAARKVVRDFSAVCAFGVEQKLLSNNPVSDARLNKVDNERTLYLRPNDVKPFLQAVRKVEKETKNSMAAAIVRLWLLTACRRNEVLEMRWEWIDFDGRRLVLPESKTGRSVRPLNDGALRILHEQQRGSSPYVFPATRGDGWYQGTRKFLDRVRKTDARFANVTPHVLRHTHASLAVSAGLNLPITGALLGHRKASSTQRYAHVADTSALDASRHVASVIDFGGVNEIETA